jgi:glutathione S-transferase
MSGVDLSKTPNLAAWLGRCTERPALKAAQG